MPPKAKSIPKDAGDPYIKSCKVRGNLAYIQLRLCCEADPSYQKSDRVRGITTELGITKYWSLLFELNELLPPNRKMTDAEILTKVKSQYPHKDWSYYDRPANDKKRQTVNQMRVKYNKGQFTGWIRPAIQSNRYDHEGYRISGRSGTPDPTPRNSRVATGLEIGLTPDSTPVGPAQPFSESINNLTAVDPLASESLPSSPKRKKAKPK